MICHRWTRDIRYMILHSHGNSICKQRFLCTHHMSAAIVIGSQLTTSGAACGRIHAYKIEKPQHINMVKIFVCFVIACVQLTVSQFANTTSCSIMAKSIVSHYIQHATVHQKQPPSYSNGMVFIWLKHHAHNKDQHVCSSSYQQIQVSLQEFELSCYQ